MGCDIEEIKEYKEKVAKRFFTSKENEYLDLTNDKDGLFYRLWTLKESYVKCIGKGLSVPLNSFELSNNSNNVIVQGKDNYQFFEFKHDNYHISICLNINAKEKEKRIEKMFRQCCFFCNRFHKALKYFFADDKL